MTDTRAPLTVGAMIEAAADALDRGGVVFGHGTDNAWDEATALVLGVSGVADDRANLDVRVADAHAVRILELLRRRIEERIPLPYLLGHAGFAGHTFLIEPGVVIPRSPIAELIERRFAPWLEIEPGRIVDVCCGSGCIGIAAALEFPAAELVLVDVDPRALALAERNVALHGLTGRTRIVRSDLLDDVEPGRFDLILSNPPYVDREDMQSLPAEFRHEPALGLDGGVDGLVLVRRLLDSLPERLSASGVFVCEVGRSAPALLDAYRLPFVWPDLERGGEGVFILPGR